MAEMKPFSSSRRRWMLVAGIAASGLVSPIQATPAANRKVDRTWTRYVNPFVGTDGTGHTFPGATVPFGMVAPSPDNADRGWDYTSGYQFRNPRILGFSNTHISGAGIPDLGDVLLMPSQGQAWHAGSVHFAANKARRSETAEPGYYSVQLPSHQVRVELTATQRVALHRYTFAHPGRVQVLVDLQHGLHFNEPHRVKQAQSSLNLAQGEITGTVHSVAWVERQTSFIVRFDRPALHAELLPMPTGHKAHRYLLTFEVDASRQLEVRVALSTVDETGARHNLAEALRLDFDAARVQARKTWNDLLGRIEIEAPRPDPSRRHR
jgi:putative alpha-1,2-mannosidase